MSVADRVRARHRARYGVMDTSSIETDWRRWVKTMFPHHISKEFAWFHEEVWKWIWSIQPDIKPEPLVDIIFRAGAKSSTAEMGCPALAARGKRHYAFYISGTQDQADDHVISVAALLEESNLHKYYPSLARPKVGKHGERRGWRRNRLWTAGDFIVDAAGLDSAVRGAKLGRQRPDIMILDDIDSKKDSLDTTAKKIDTLTTSILPSGSDDCAVLAIQNLILRHGIFTRLDDGRADYLLNHRKIGPVKMVENAEYERRGRRYFIIGGTPSWPAMTIENCQAKLDEWGYRAFRLEAQHEVKDPEPGQIFPMYDPVVHDISWSMFAEKFGAEARDENRQPMLPRRGHIGRFQDWGTTHAHPCMTLWIWRPPKAMELNDCFFIYRELGFPESIYDPTLIPEPVAPSTVGRQVIDIERDWFETERVRLSLMSHEASAACNTYNYEMPVGYRHLKFGKWQPRKKGGIPELQEYLTPDTSRPHPFKPDHQKSDGKYALGQPRLFLVVADDQLYAPVDRFGLARLKWEIPQYKNPQTAAGTEIDDPTRSKKDDDAIDALRMGADVMFVSSEAKTEENKIEEALPEKLRRKTIENLPPLQKNEAESHRYYVEAQIRKKLQTAEGPMDYRRALKSKYPRIRKR